MRHLVALLIIGASAIGYSALTDGTVAHVGSHVTTVERRLAEVERAVRTLPCVLAPAGSTQRDGAISVTCGRTASGAAAQ